MYTVRFSELAYPLGMQYADSFGAGNHDTNWVSLQNYHRAVILINVGDMAQGSTLNGGIWQATTTAGGGTPAVVKSITELTQAAGDGDQLICMELQTEELDVDGGYDCIRLRLTVANAAVEFGAWVFGISPRFPPVPTTNWEEVVA